MSWTRVLALILLLPGRGVGAELVDRIIVVVNDDLILESEVDEEVSAILVADPDAVPPGPGREKALVELREMVVEGLIGRKLSDQAIARLGITVEDAEVDAQLSETARANNMTVEQLSKELARQGIPIEDFRKDLHEQLKQFKLFQAEIGTKIDISEDLLLQRYNERFAQVPEDPEYHLRVIVLRYPDAATAEDIEAVRVRAVALREMVLSGTPFDEVAEQHSEDPGSASKGGNFGKVRPRSMIPEFRDAVEGLPLNDVSDPVEFQNALWLIQIHRITNASVPTFEEVRWQLFDQLYQEEEERQIGLWIEREKIRAHIEYLH